VRGMREEDEVRKKKGGGGGGFEVIKSSLSFSP